MVQSFRDHSLHRMGVVLMDKKPFDFKALMAFGMFILALLWKAIHNNAYV